MDHNKEVGMVEGELLTVRQVSGLIGIPEATLRYWRHANQGPASFALGRRVLYRRSEVERWISTQEQATRRGGDAA